MYIFVAFAFELNCFSCFLSDRHTGELLVRLNPTASPSFHNYGNDPPSSVLDLGCGQGYVVLSDTSLLISRR